MKTILSMSLERMNQGRILDQPYVYRKLVLVLNGIARFQYVQATAQHGSKIVLRRADYAESINWHLEHSRCIGSTQNLQNGIWSIPDALIENKRLISDSNVRVLEDFENKFPFLSWTIFYRKK